MFFSPYTTSSIVLAVDGRSVVDRSVLDRSSVTNKGVDEDVDSSGMGEVSVVSAVLLPLVPELLLLGLELLEEGRGSVTCDEGMSVVAEASTSEANTGVGDGVISAKSWYVLLGSTITSLLSRCVGRTGTSTGVDIIVP